MKTIRVNLLGEERLERETGIHISVPDDVTEEELRELGAECFQRIADDSGADWETNDSSGIEIQDDEDGLGLTEVEGAPDVVAVLEREANGELAITYQHKIATNEAAAYDFGFFPPQFYAKANGVMLEEFPAMNEVIKRLFHLPPQETYAWGQLLAGFGQRLMELGVKQG